MIRMSQNPEQDVQDQLQATMAAAPPVAAYMQPVDPHASLTAPIGPAPQPAPAMAVPKQGESKMAQAQKPIEDNLTMRLKKDYQKDADPYGSPDNHPGFFGKLLHGLNVATGGVNRRGMEEQGLENRLQGLEKNESEEGLQGSQAKKINTEEVGDELENQNKPQQFADTHALNESTIAEHNAQAMNLLHPQAKTDFEAWQKQNPGKPIEEWLKALSASKAEKPDPARQQLVDEYQKQHPGSSLADANKYASEALQAPQRPPVINVGNQDFQMQERGRQLLDKAEAQYRTAQQGANGLRDMIAQADAGNKVSAQVLPLQGALEITTAQGVHRINRTEVDQYAGAGSLWDRVAGELGKVAAGDPIPFNIRQDMRKLADIEEQAAYQNYLGAHQSATRRYHLQDEEPLKPPSSGQTQSSSAQPIVQQSPSTGQFRYSTDGGKTWQAGKPKGQ